MTVAPHPGHGRLIKRTARVVSVAFEPTTVKLKIGTRTATVAADEPQVDAALRHRHDDVIVALIESDDSPKLVWIQPASTPAPAPPLEATAEHLRTRWAETLRVLAH